jgi:hypothetical protein
LYAAAIEELDLMIARTLACCTLFVSAGTAVAEPTEIVVRVISQDAKFIGDLTGGARVTLRDANRRRILAQGVTKGSTGDTGRIMEASGRSPVRHAPGTAAFRASIDLAVPTLVDLEVEGPLARPQSMIRVVSQRWLMPGQAVSAGDGWTVELPGLAITPTVRRERGSLAVTAKVELMCGCPITPDGLWRAADYRVEASLWRGARRISTTPLAFASAPGNYAGSLPEERGDGLRLIVSARNIVTANSGVAQMAVR